MLKSLLVKRKRGEEMQGFQQASVIELIRMLLDLIWTFKHLAPAGISGKIHMLFLCSPSQ